MPRQGHGIAAVEGVRLVRKNRKRGCSSSSSASSRILSFRLSKRAIFAGNSLAGVSGSRSATPATIWRTTQLRNAMDSHSPSVKSTRPVSARRLAATLWEMNEIPSTIHGNQHKKRNDCKRDELPFGFDPNSGSNSLLDQSQSPSASERMERSAKGSRRSGRPRSISERLMMAEQGIAAFDSVSRSSFMEVERRSTSNRSVFGAGNKSRLKDISNTLTTSKELLKIISNLSARADQSLSGLSVISALHAELERARLQVNHLVQEQRKHTKEIEYLLKCFAEEKESWRNKEHHAIESAVRAVSSELEAERKLRRRLESLNKKLGNELAEMKHSFFETVKELESEKRTREITEQMCDELARNVDEDRATAMNGFHEDAEKGRNDNKIRSKMSQPRNRFEEKNSAISKLRKQLEVFLGVRRDKDADKSASLSIRSTDHVAGNGIRSMEPNPARNSQCSSQVSWRTTSLQTSVSDVEALNVQNLIDSVNKPPRRSNDRPPRQKVVTGLDSSSTPYQQATGSKSRLANIWEGEMDTKRGMW